MAQTFTRDSAATLVSTALNGVFDSSKKLVDPVYKKFVKEKNPKTAVYKENQIAYFTDIPLIGDGAQIEYGDVKVGTTLTITPKRYALGVRFTADALDDMAADPYGDFSNAQLISAQRIGKAFRVAAEQKRDVLAAQFILSMDSATASEGLWQGAGYDGKALTASDHPIMSATSVLGGTTFSNLGAASSLSQSTLQTLLQTLETIPSQEGLVRPLGKKYKLMVGPNLRHTAYTAVETAKKGALVGSTDHDIPGLKDFDIEVVVNPFLGSSSTRYALIGPNADLYYWNRKDDEIEDQPDFQTLGHLWRIDFRCAFMHTSPYDFIGSLGA